MHVRNRQNPWDVIVPAPFSSLRTLMTNSDVKKKESKVKPFLSLLFSFSFWMRFATVAYLHFWTMVSHISWLISWKVWWLLFLENMWGVRTLQCGTGPLGKMKTLDFIIHREAEDDSLMFISFITLICNRYIISPVLNLS